MTSSPMNTLLLLRPPSPKPQTPRHIPLTRLHPPPLRGIGVFQIPEIFTWGPLRCCGIPIYFAGFASCPGSGPSSYLWCCRPAPESDAHLRSPHRGDRRAGGNGGSGRGWSGERFVGWRWGLIMRAERLSFFLVLEVGGGGEREG